MIIDTLDEWDSFGVGWCSSIIFRHKAQGTRHKAQGTIPDVRDCASESFVILLYYNLLHVIADLDNLFSS